MDNQIRNSEISPTLEESLVMNNNRYEVDDDEQDGGIAKGGKSKCSSSSWITQLMTIIFVLVFVTLLVYWVTGWLRLPMFTVDEGQVHPGYDLTSNNHLTAAFNFAVRANNPNSKITLYYESLEIKAYHGGQFIGYAGVYPFLQPHGNVTSFGFGGVASDMPLFELPGEVDFDVELKGTFSYKLGFIKFNEYYLEGKCSPVIVYFNSTRGFQSTNCRCHYRPRNWRRNGNWHSTGALL